MIFIQRIYNIWLVRVGKVISLVFKIHLVFFGTSLYQNYYYYYFIVVIDGYLQCICHLWKLVFIFSILSLILFFYHFHHHHHDILDQPKIFICLSRILYMYIEIIHVYSPISCSFTFFFLPPRFITYQLVGKKTLKIIDPKHGPTIIVIIIYKYIK